MKPTNIWKRLNMNCFEGNDLREKGLQLKQETL